MKTIESLVPGSPAWLQSRSASKAPAMMGVSKYQTRSDLLKQMATGLKEDVDANTQRLFDAGHASEAAAREIAEDILSDGLSPVCGATDDGYLTASFDGLTFDGKVGFEHKLWNERLAAAVRLAAMGSSELPEEYRVQMDQQILVGGLDYVLFMVSDGTREKCVSMEYRSTPERAAKLLAAWHQFDEDLANYKPVEILPEAVAAPHMALPALSIQVNGSISLIDNLEIFGRKLTDFIAGLPVKPETDQQFADADSAVKTLKTAEEALDAAESSALAQTASIDQMRRTVGLYRDQARTARLMLDKLVKARKENIRIEIAQKAKEEFVTFVGNLNAQIGKPYLVPAIPDFAGAMKGMKKVDSCRGAVADLMAQAKIAANDAAGKIIINMQCLRDLAHGYAFLFSDTQQLVTTKATDDLVLVIKSRIADHLAAEAKREEETRQRIRAEEEAKATAKAELIAKQQRELDAGEDAAIVAKPTEPATRPAPVISSGRLDETAVVAAHTGITGSARLMDRLDDLVRQMTEQELSELCIHAAHILESRKAAA